MSEDSAAKGTPGPDARLGAGPDAGLEARLTDWGRLVRSATGPQPAPELSASPARQPGSFGWHLTAGVLAVALAAVIAVGLPGLLAKDPTPAGSPNATSAASPPTSAASPPTSTASPDVTSTASAGPGFQVVTFHGLSITVPDSWAVTPDYNTCNVTTNVVELMVGISLTCYQPADPNLTRVEFLASTELRALSDVRSTSRTTISGLEATRTEGYSSEGRAGFGYVVPELHASVLIWPARGQSGQELADSLRVDAVDKHGCRSSVTDVAEFPSSATSDRAGMAQALIPGRPESASVCRYRVGLLEMGNELSGPALQAFAATLNDLPRGLSRAVEPPMGKCREPGSLGSFDDKELDADLDVYRIEVRYPDGPPVVLIAKLGQCGDLGISNGARTGQRTNELMVSLLRLARAGAGVPARVEPAP